MRKILYAVAVLGCLSLYSNAYSDTIANTFGTNDSFNSSAFGGVFWEISEASPSLNVGRGIAASFTPIGHSYSLTSVSLAMFYWRGTNNLAISIVADNNGSPSGALIETMTLHPTGITNPQSQIVAYSSALNSLMVNGNNYWLVVSPADLNTVDESNNSRFGWFGSESLGFVGAQSFDFANGTWDAWQVYPNSLLPAFRIEGTLVPEPDTLWVLLGGFTVFGFLRLRKHHFSAH